MLQDHRLMLSIKYSALKY